MIVGIGTDIVEIARLKTAVERSGDAFLQRVYTAAELAEAEGRFEYLGGRWAAKEAAAKALGCGIGEKCSFADVEIIDAPSGAPTLVCKAPMAKKLSRRYHELRWHVSISHERAYAVATVIIESGGSSI